MKNNEDIDGFLKTLGLAAAGFLLIGLSPIVVLSVVFGYFSWASFHHNTERRYLRSGLILIFGFWMTTNLWGALLNVIPTIDGISPVIVRLAAKAKLAHLAYGILVPAVFYLLHNHPRKNNILLYNKSRNIILEVINWVFRVNPAITFVILLFFMATLVPKKPVEDFRSLIGVSLCSLFVVFLYALYARRQRGKLSDNYIEQMKSKKGMEIGQIYDPKQMSLKLQWEDINHHIHVVGQPGSGKSVLLKNIYAHQIVNGEGLLMLDLKADLDVKEDFKSLCFDSNRQKDLIIIDLSNPDQSHGYNPLLLGNATELKDKIVGSIEWSEPYYKKVSERVLLTVLKGIVWLRTRGETPTLNDLYTAISSVQGLSQLASMVQDQEIKSDINQLIATFTKEFAKDLEGLKTDLALLVKSEFGSIFDKDHSINLTEIIQQKKVVLINLDGQTYNESAKKFGRLILSDLRAASGAIVTRQSKDDRPQFTVIVDEFSDIVATEDMAKTFVGFLNRCRGSGIGVIIAHQSLGDFKDKTVMSQILDSTETLFSFVQKDPETCQILADIVGTREEWKETEQTESGIIFTGSSPTGMGTRRESHEYIYHPNVFKNLNTGEAVYIAKKPTRHGRLVVNMLSIPRLENPISQDEFGPAQVQMRTKKLELGKVIQQNGIAYKEALKSRPEADLEI